MEIHVSIWDVKCFLYHLEGNNQLKLSFDYSCVTPQERWHGNLQLPHIYKLNFIRMWSFKLVMSCAVPCGWISCRKIYASRRIGWLPSFGCNSEKGKQIQEISVNCALAVVLIMYSPQTITTWKEYRWTNYKALSQGSVHLSWRYSKVSRRLPSITKYIKSKIKIEGWAITSPLYFC